MADPNRTPQTRIRIFDRSGIPLAEFRANVNYSLVIGDEGRAQFDYPTRKTDVVNDDVLRPGNWIFVQNDSLPSWVGMLDMPYYWGTRKLTISAYTPEKLFEHRVGPLEEVITGSAGTIFARLINLVNQKEQTILRTGNIWTGGTQRQETLNPQPLKEYLRGLWERSGEDYAWVPSVGADGKLLVYGNWLPSLGAETSALLHEGKGGGNVEAVDRIMIEDGPIINSFLAYGNGETWASRPNVTQTAPNSIGAYGLRETAEEFPNTTNVTTLAENAAQKLREFYIPARTFQINALNKSETFQHVKLGNILQLQLQSAGFKGSGLGYSGRVRIIGLQYDPQYKNRVKLVLREVV